MLFSRLALLAPLVLLNVAARDAAQAPTTPPAAAAQGAAQNPPAKPNAGKGQGANAGKQPGANAANAPGAQAPKGPGNPAANAPGAQQPGAQQPGAGKQRGGGKGAAPAGGAQAPATTPATPGAQAPGAPGAAADPQAPAQPAPVPEEPKPPRELKTLTPTRWMVLEATDKSGRRPFRPDAVFAKYLAFPGAATPTPDDVLVGETGVEQRWQQREPVEGVLQGDFGYAFTTIELEDNGVWIAQLNGASSFFVNGIGFVGDAYDYGFGGVPIALKKGPNNIFVRGRRGDVRFVLREPEAPVMFAGWSSVQPDLVAGRDVPNDEFGSVLLFNATQETTRPMELSLTSGDGYFKERKFPVAPMGPLSIRTAFFTLDRKAAPAPNEKPNRHAVTLWLQPRGGKAFTSQRLTIEVKDATAARRATFDSLIEGSIQSFAVLPPTDATARDSAVVLSLHGASVEALGQVQSYSAKPGMWLVAPTNRRPYGFDWQDWGRDDAYEALDAALKLTGADPARVFVTGHSMGGHGTWHLGTTDPWRFAAIAPSAGWSSFDTYGGRPEGELAWLWRAADASSRTEDLIANLRSTPTYILHGDADDNVPAKEARDLEALLVGAGGRPSSHYQPSAGHWWDGDASAGVDCVDWPGIFELFAATPARVLSPQFDFLCADPSVNATYGPFVLDQPLEYGAPLRLVGTWRADEGVLALETTNVRRLRVDFAKIESVGVRVKSFVIDGHVVDVWNDLRVAQIGDPTWFVRESESWAQDASRGRVSLASTWRAYSVDGAPRYDGEKSSETSGPFKRAFGRHFALVYGTGGSPQENKALYERARCDQQVWWYRANGTPALLSDADFLADEARKDRPIRNVILYGNSRTNQAWSTVVPADAPIRVRPGSIELGAQRWTGSDLCALFVLPRADAKRDRPPYLRDPALDPKLAQEVPAWPLVGVVADTGLAGIRAGYQLSPFVSGVGYPDYAVFSSEVSRTGDGGVLAAGWFDHRWRLQPGGFLRASAVTGEASR
ncbi:MAG: prolyl oligopeptidase family serine peptidase [Planctomycetes bacterium]|nr:prolyl oligopeptidase family serine peptidase [Planctomycetota bacterium]